jgi:hypothetical protein
MTRPRSFVERKFDIAVPVQEAMRKLWPQTAFTTTDVTPWTELVVHLPSCAVQRRDCIH